MVLSRLWRVLVLTVAAVTATAVLAAPEAYAAGSRWRIFDRASGKLCLDGGSGSGGGTYVWSCVNASNQYWYFDPAGPANYYRIRNAKSGKCLRVQGGVHASAPVYNGDCGNTWDAWWVGVDRETDSDGRDWYHLTPYYVAGQYCLNATGTANGNAVWIDPCFGPLWTNLWSWSVA
jgi:hypothetical protein